MTAIISTLGVPPRQHGALRTSTATATPPTGATEQGHALGVVKRIREDDDHARRHALQHSAAGTANCSPPVRGKETTSLLTHACNPSLLRSIKGGRSARSTTGRRTHANSHLHSQLPILALASITPSTSRDLGASVPLPLKFVPPTTSTPVQDNIVLAHPTGRMAP